MVDIGKMVEDGDKSPYVTPHWPCWISSLVCLAVGFVLGWVL